MKAQVGDRTEGYVFSYRTPPYKLLRESKLMEAAGVPYSRPFHEYRKSVKYRSKMIRKLPPELTKEFQGHQTDSMDQYYLHLRTQDLYVVVQDTWEPVGDQKRFPKGYQDVKKGRTRFLRSAPNSLSLLRVYW